METAKVTKQSTVLEERIQSYSNLLNEIKNTRDRVGLLLSKLEPMCESDINNKNASDQPLGLLSILSQNNEDMASVIHELNTSVDRLEELI